MSLPHSRDRDAWLAARRDYITGSAVASMLGESSYETRDQLRMRKAGLADEADLGEGGKIRLAMEAMVAGLARDWWSWDLTEHGQLVADSECARHAATPDFTMPTPDGLATVNTKVVRSMPAELCTELTKSGRPSTQAFLRGMPLAYELQLQSEMACIGPHCRHGVLLVLHLAPDLALRAYRTQRHDGVIARIRREIPVFWKEIEALRAGKVAI